MPPTVAHIGHEAGGQHYGDGTATGRVLPVGSARMPQQRASQAPQTIRKPLRSPPRRTLVEQRATHRNSYLPLARARVARFGPPRTPERTGCLAEEPPEQRGEMALIRTAN